MRKSKKQRMTLASETLRNLEEVSPEIAGGKQIQCSVQICPQKQASEGFCSGTCTCSCGI